MQPKSEEEIKEILGRVGERIAEWLKPENQLKFLEEQLAREKQYMKQDPIMGWRRWYDSIQETERKIKEVKKQIANERN